MFKDNPLTVRKQQVKAMVARMAEAYNIEKKALPERLGTQKNVVNNWGYYGRIPYEHLYHCHQVTGVSMDWLLEGVASHATLTPKQTEHFRQLVMTTVKDNIIAHNAEALCPKTLAQLCDTLSDKLCHSIQALLKQQ